MCTAHRYQWEHCRDDTETTNSEVYCSPYDVRGNLGPFQQRRPHAPLQGKPLWAAHVDVHGRNVTFDMLQSVKMPHANARVAARRGSATESQAHEASPLSASTRQFCCVQLTLRSRRGDNAVRVRVVSIGAVGCVIIVPTD